jgi:hypothetical protein
MKGQEAVAGYLQKYGADCGTSTVEGIPGKK